MDDAQIIELYWQRSDRAVGESTQKYGAYCRTISYNIVENKQDSEECVNDTWLHAWNAIPPKLPASLRHYLGAITRNLSLNCLRARSSGKRGGGQAELALEELSECISGGESAEAVLERRELAAAIDRFLAALPEKERSIFVARYWFLAPIKELAEKTGFSQSKLTSMLHRTRKKLRDSLYKEGLI